MLKSPRKTVAAACSLFFAVPVFWLAAQSTPPPPTQAPQTAPPSSPPLSDAQAKIVVNSSLVVLPVTVKDGAGRLVADLNKDEFRVFEDDVEQRIDVFTAEAFPLSMVVLIDNDLKSKDSKQVESSLEAVVGAMSLDDEAFICRFDQFFHPGKGFTNDHDKLLTELSRTRLDSKTSTTPATTGPMTEPSINGHSVTGAPSTPGSTNIILGHNTKALDDAVFDSAQLLEDRPRNRRRIVLLISDGLNGGKKYNTNTFDSTVRELLGHNISVFGVGVGSAFYDRRFERLSEYAHATGGDIYYAISRESMEELYSSISEEARNEYTLAYVPRNTDRAKEYHDIEVRVRRPGLKIVTRNRYYSGAIPR